MIRADPPAETSGNGTPMTGARPITTAMFISACPITQHMMAPVAILTNGSGCRRMMRAIASAINAKSTSTSNVPTSPSSSPMIAKMKSFCRSGR